MLVIHGNPFSSCTRLVLFTFLEMGLRRDKDFSVAAADLTQIKGEEWLKHQPFGQMPWLEDTENGVELFEARAIAKYVAAKTNSPLLPQQSDLTAWAKYETASSFELTDWHPAVYGMFVDCVMKEMYGAEVNTSLLESHQKHFVQALEGYERVLAKQAFTVGDKETLIDLFHAPYGAFAVSTGYCDALTNGSFPHVQKWWTNLTEKDNWKTVLKWADEAFAEMMAKRA